MSAALLAVLGPAALAWVAWCWVLVRREDAASRLTLAEAEHGKRDAYAEATAARHDVVAMRSDIDRLARELHDLTNRVQGVQLRQGMR